MWNRRPPRVFDRALLHCHGVEVSRTDILFCLINGTDVPLLDDSALRYTKLAALLCARRAAHSEGAERCGRDHVCMAVE
jgi:hypothetical protein